MEKPTQKTDQNEQQPDAKEFATPELTAIVVASVRAMAFDDACQEKATHLEAVREQ